MIPHWSEDPFATRSTIHGLPSDQVRSALHKHVRRGRFEEAVRAAVELARTDEEHEAEMWRRLQVLAAEDVGLGDTNAIVVVRALHESALDAPPGSYDRLVFAAQAAATLARAPKDPTNVEIMQVALHTDTSPEIPDEAICIHTRAGQEAGRTLADWFEGAAILVPEVEGRDTSWRDDLTGIYADLSNQARGGPPT